MDHFAGLDVSVKGTSACIGGGWQSQARCSRGVRHRRPQGGLIGLRRQRPPSYQGNSGLRRVKPRRYCRQLNERRVPAARGVKWP